MGNKIRSAIKEFAARCAVPKLVFLSVMVSCFFYGDYPAACSAAEVKTEGADIPFLGIVQSGIAPELLKDSPGRVAVLPATASEKVRKEFAKAQDTDPIGILRTVFFGRFSVCPFQHVHIREVDKLLSANPDWAGKSTQDLGSLLAAAALVAMEITKAENVTAGIHSYTEYEATVRMLRAADGKELWRAKLDFSSRGGIISFKSSQLGSLVEFEQQNSNREKAFRLAAEEWSRRVVRDLRSKIEKREWRVND